MLAIEKPLLSSPASYTYLETIKITFFASAGLHSWKEADSFSREPNRRLAICLNTDEAFLGNNRLNPFHYRKFGLKQIFIYRKGLPVANSPISTEDDKRLYFNAISDSAYIADGHGIKLSEYPSHFLMVFHLTSTQQAFHDFIHPRADTQFNNRWAEVLSGSSNQHWDFYNWRKNKYNLRWQCTMCVEKPCTDKLRRSKWLNSAL